ncbi:hypothetical protein C7974DRAFT_377647 [Boeremia exigua]|uniref:uncharacterized protein n=1 Tax=Boeremia exigua TaxID=749465 RepID=UPI001E8EAB85|nr:uncharacterized protein C7974DRAFT_377647 [Boeremia exigua]KAH6622022.1 hypothetical protein C7974DRAFT_377647 [Boeremia exigua]
MMLEKLPVELVRRIFEFVLDDDDLQNLTALLGVNTIFEAETSKLYESKIRHVRPEATYWARIPCPVRRRMARDIIMSHSESSSKRTIATYMHSVASYLLRLSHEFDANNAGLNHTQWWYKVISVLASSEADCRCGKPAFLHLTCHSLWSVSDTAFHVVILERHTRLEIAMIERGKGAESTCPYLKVSKKDPTFARRNALEWACSQQLEDTVHRLVFAAEKAMKRPEQYLPTATAICAATHQPHRGDTPLLCFLLDRLSITSWKRNSSGPMFTYQSRLVSFKEWNRRVLSTLAQHKARNTQTAILIMRTYYPYLEFGNTLNLISKNLGRQDFGRRIIAGQRPFCRFARERPDDYINAFGPDAEWIRHWHLTICNADTCLRQPNRACPRCGLCGRRHAADANWRNGYGRDGSPLSAGTFEDIVAVTVGERERGSEQTTPDPDLFRWSSATYLPSPEHHNGPKSCGGDD